MTGRRVRYDLCMRRRTIIAFSILVLFAAGALLGACGDGNKPAVTPGTLLPSASGGPGGPGGKPGGTSPSASPATITPSSSPSATTGGGEITDASIKANILRRIAESPALSGLRIRVVVRDALVYLKGNVKTAEQKNAVEQIAVTEPGIAKVVSYLIVEPKGDGGY